MIIAIDGPAAAGKGTLARKLAAKLDYAYLDTGALYRATALGVLAAESSAPLEEIAASVSAALPHALLSHTDLRLEATGDMASQVASIPQVRSNLLAFQRNFASSPPENKAGAILDGRDIGTVICPNADAKLFVTASAEVRATRRLEEMKAAKRDANFDDILADVKARDERDMNRQDAPLKPAKDALLLDTSDLTIEAAFLRALELINARLGS